MEGTDYQRTIQIRSDQIRSDVQDPRMEFTGRGMNRREEVVGRFRVDIVEEGAGRLGTASAKCGWAHYPTSANHL